MRQQIVKEITLAVCSNELSYDGTQRAGDRANAEINGLANRIMQIVCTSNPPWALSVDTIVKLKQMNKELGRYGETAYCRGFAEALKILGLLEIVTGEE